MRIAGKVSSPEQLGKLLQQGRAIRGISQRDLADELGVTQRYIWEIENGKHSKFADRLFAMARATGVQLVGELEFEPDHADTDSKRPERG